ncbi:hypothetical protein [Pseudomonas brassicacearum]|uniref:hypothetical protein n=1 Tax=Pseudomonas brassicacearum TaxID=930166 RepID=UPI001297B8F5|nr:hypothetical protein [Pseudomonas brassicacearum]QGA51773.1 hypothetical protein GFU70_22540 [Pseudomonas brassicacearum]
MSVDNESDKHPSADVMQGNGEEDDIDGGDERARMNGRTIIRATKDGYWADYELDHTWSADGSTFTLRSSRYRAADNGRTSGNAFAKVITLVDPEWTALTGDDAVQDEQWRGLAKVITVNSYKPDHSVTVGFYFIYDRRGVEDVHMYGYKDFPFVPQAPVINSIQNVPGRRFTVSGKGGVDRVGIIQLHQTNNNNPIGAPATVESNTWSTEINLPSDIRGIDLYGRQKIGEKWSGKSVSTGYIHVAEVTTPSAGSVVLSDAEFSGRAAPGTRVKMVKSGSPNEEVTKYYDVRDDAQWKLELDPPLASGKHRLTVWLRLNGFADSYTSNLEYEVLGIPAITAPEVNSTQSIPFTLSGNNGLSGATIKIYRSDDSARDPKGSGSVDGNGSWSATVGKQLPFGRVSLVVEQEKGGKKSGNSALRQFIIPPNVPTINFDTNNGVIRLYGTGLADARLDIHFRNNATPYLDTVVEQGGTWEKIIPANLVPGSYVFSARQRVPDGGGWIYSGYSSNLSVEVPVPRPTALEIRLAGQKPTFLGRGLRWDGYNTYVRIYSDKSPIDGVSDADVGNNLQWQTTATKDLAPGRYTKLSAQQVVNSKNSAHTDDHQITIPSPIPGLSEPKAAPEYTTQRPLFEGTAWRGSTVELKFTDGPASIPLTAPDGTFRHQVNEDWAPGLYTVTATASFNDQPAETVRSFLVRTPKPTITTSGSVDMDPRIEGTGWPSGWVVIHKGDNTVLGEGPVDAQSRKFSVQLSQQSQGILVVYAKQALAQDSTNISEETARVTLTVEIRAPVIQEPLVKTTRTSTFSGTGTTGGTVEFYLNDVNDPIVDGIPVEGGEWQTTLELPAGNPKLEVALRHFGVLSAKQLHPITVVPAPPIVDTPLPGEALGDVLHISGFGFPEDQIRIDRRSDQQVLGRTTVTPAGTWTASVKNELVNDDDTIGAFASAGAGLDSTYSPWLKPTLLLKDLPHFTEPLPNDRVGLRPWYAGIATPNATIRVASWFNTDELLAPSTVADQFGRWQVMGNKDLPEGPTRVAVRQTMNSVHSQWVESGRFIVEKMPAGFRPPTVDYPRLGQEVGRYPMFSGSGVPGARIYICEEEKYDPSLIPNCWVGRDGRWAVQSIVELPIKDDFKYSTQQYRDGASSLWLTPNRDIKVIQVQEGFAPAVIHTPEKETTVERRPLFAGTGTPGASLHIFSRSEEDLYRKYGETQVDAQGHWSMRSDVQLDVRSHAISCVQKLDGQDSTKPATVNFTVTDVIDLPVVTSPASEDESVPPEAVIRGTAMPGVMIKLATSGDESIVWGTTVVDELGQWVIVTRPLPLGLFIMAALAYKDDGARSYWRQFKFTVRDIG